MARNASDQPRGLKKRNDLLQEMRGLAAVSVLLFHAHILYVSPRSLGTSYTYLGGLFEAGDAAVDFFFALSGFLMVFVHRREEGQPAFVKLFFLKRISRIYPPYWVVMAVLIPLFFVLPRLDGSPRDLSPRKMVETMLLLPQDTPLLMTAAWSLTHELFFYLIFGTFFFARRGAFAALAVAWFLAIASTSINSTAHDLLLANKWLVVAFSPRNLGFLGGCLVGYVEPVLSSQFKKPAFWAGLVIFTLAWAANVIDEEPTTPVSAFPYAFASSLIILGSGSVNLGSRSWLLVLGDASYSIYITHLSGIALMIRFGLKLRVPERAGLFASATAYVLGALALGLAFHFVIERPLMRLSRALIAKLRRPELAERA